MVRKLFVLASLLMLPLALLLFGQWPLRDLVQAGSRQANDIGQIAFALYMAVAVTAASRAGAHLAAGRSALARRARWRAWALLACVGPWAVFMLWTSWAPVLDSLRQFERFGETLTPGFFVIKLALWLMLALVLLNAVADVLAPQPQDGP